MPVTLPHTFGTATPQPPEAMQFLDDNFNALLAPINSILGGTGGAAVPTIPVVNAQTGATYTILASDLGKLVTFTNAGAIAVTLPQATGAFAAPFMFYVRCLPGSTGSATITPTTSTIDGASSLVLAPGIGAMIVTDPSGNYQIARYAAKGALSPGTPNVMNPYAGSTQKSQAHGLSAVPTVFSSYLQCLTAEHGYNIGDVAIPWQAYFDSTNNAITIRADATNTYIVTGPTLPIITDTGTFVASLITAANWKFILQPYALI